MAARSTHVTLDSPAGVQRGFNLRLRDAELEHGVWNVRPPTLIGNRGEWESESDGFLTGTEGNATYQLEDVDGTLLGELLVRWNNPFIGSNSYSESVDPQAGPSNRPQGFSVVHLGGGGDNASVTFRLLSGLCEVGEDGEVSCSSSEEVEQRLTGLAKILFVRDDGLFAVAHIDSGELAMTQSGDNAATGWTHVVAVQDQILFVRDDGLFAVAHIDSGELAMTHSGDNAATGWTHVVAVQDQILFVRDDGLFAVAHIDSGELAMTHSGDNAATGWTHVVAIA
jgi:hypothetical protein